MKNNSRIKSILQSLNHYLIFFLIIAFVITCCIMLFVTILQNTMGIKFTEDQISAAAKLTFLNVLGFSAIFTLLDGIRRRFIVIRPIRRIIQAAEKLSKGDFSVRVPRVHGIIGEDMFNQIGDCFNQLAQELSGVETLRTDFVANVSHELKTPLAVMQNYGTMLQAPELPEEQRLEYAKAITDACRRLANLITNILKLNKLENQQIYPIAAEYDLSEQICECLLQFEEAWEKKNINIETDMEDGVRITSDAELLSHVWNNLFSNAIKFTEPGGTVSVSLKNTDHHLIVKVSDTGCGMSPEVGAHIFDKFYQGDTSHSTQGNGLGLALVKRVVDIMRGEICVESETGKGSTFMVKLRRS
ncbi:MAG: HAMP domain-containing histidine kinase [Clostridia bacterium]|nr:HAMP domain-containing histidine kinase [Clostridia bacterium]